MEFRRLLFLSARLTSREQVLANTDLTQSTELLRNNPKIRVQICEDDFLLTPADLPWFRSTFGNNLTDYPVGGHLGNLHISAVQEALVRLFPAPGEAHRPGEASSGVEMKKNKKIEL